MADFSQHVIAGEEDKRSPIPFFYIRLNRGDDLAFELLFVGRWIGQIDYDLQFREPLVIERAAHLQRLGFLSADSLLKELKALLLAGRECGAREDDRFHLFE